MGYLRKLIHESAWIMSTQVSRKRQAESFTNLSSKEVEVCFERSCSVPFVVVDAEGRS
jgi:hypothetical protein